MSSLVKREPTESERIMCNLARHMSEWHGRAMRLFECLENLGNDQLETTYWLKDGTQYWSWDEGRQTFMRMRGAMPEIQFEIAY